MATSTPTSNDRLPSTLFTVYQTYKRGTCLVLEWLTSFDRSPTPVSAANAITIKQLLEKAKKASKSKRNPPQTIHDAFKVVLVNRNKLTKYYDRLPTTSADTIAATTRHKVFNETLAQAYSILFPTESPKGKPKRPITNVSQATPTVNSFETLAHIVEEEPDFDACASDFWQAEAPSNSANSSITDDSVGEAVALHTYVTELQTTIETIKNLWKSVSAGEISLAAAGSLTNMVQNYLIQWIRSQSPVTDHHDALLRSFFHEKDNPAEARGSFVPRWLQDPEGFRSGHEQDFFQDLTNGYGLIWPYNEICQFEALIGAKDESLNLVERRKFEDYFKAHSQQKALKQDFVDSILAYLPTKEANTVAEHVQKLTNIATKRYQHDQDIVRSMFRSIYQHPLWASPFEEMMDSLSCRSDWMKDSYGEDNLQFPLSVPLLWLLKEAQKPKMIMRTSLIMGVHLFVESCRSSLNPPKPTEYLRITNSRIKVLSFANDSRNAILKLLEAGKDPAKAKSLDRWTPRAKDYVKQLDKFSSLKVFDLYSQSPWVAGSYMATIAARNMLVGSWPLNKDGCLSNMLHMYNMLQQIGFSCPRIPILEHLCDLLSPAIFPHSQGRPTSNFDNTARVTNGQELWYMRNGMPEFAGLKRMVERTNNVRTAPPISIWTMSEFATQTILQCRLDTNFLVKITDKLLSNRKHDVRPNVLAHFTPSEILLRAKDHILPEFEGPFPVAKVNFFAVMDLMLDFFKDVAGRISKPGGLPEDMQLWSRTIVENSGVDSFPDISSNTVKAANDFLEQARLFIDKKDLKSGAAGLKRARQNECLALLRDAMVKVCGDVKPEDYLWKDM
ncbi:uncharacterized protein J4E84_005217 [Alternaria hordeiaustralica]|uniref:uncharacterized protein n=1 Tax=Alternaria hordeiaustralica TaxID=1187925 RepID=UPI0020C349A7|nr:uncharacterized protein J4E84_005217 [Alternaria hordeiaustralica]KAI4688286.1 hypothetical protein J4E84_005217 [Alternaria hordeiaustralica]